MNEFFVMTTNGVKPPKYKHTSFEDALTEAKRLHQELNTEAYVLEVVAKLSFEEVPVTRRESKITILRGLDDDLPF